MPWGVRWAKELIFIAWDLGKGGESASRELADPGEG